MPRTNIGISYTGLSWICSSLLGMCTKMLEKRLDTAEVTPDLADRQMFKTWIMVLRSATHMLASMGTQLVNNDLEDMDLENGFGDENIIDGIEYGQPILNDLESDLHGFADVMASFQEDSFLSEYMEMNPDDL